MDINNEQFTTSLRSALHYLYDPDQLRRSPLTVLFGVAERVDAPSALQKILLDAIEALKPGDSESPQSRGWVMYDVLFFRYVRGYTREAVASQLGISDRQFSREQRAAIETLALYLWKTYELENQQQAVTAQANPGKPPEGGETENAGSPSGPTASKAPADTGWVENLPAEKPSAWMPILHSVLELLHPLVQQHEVTLRCEPDEDLPDLVVPQYALRHSLLNVLGLLIPLARGGDLLLEPFVADQELVMKAVRTGGELTAPDHPSLSVARQLVERAGGRLTVDISGPHTQISFAIPALEQIPVLLIDDNADVLQLFQRYAQGSRYSVTATQNPGEAHMLVKHLRPRIVIMDLMMPEVDGWELLTHLRQEYSPEHMAIILCSILPQESLARTLGASGFLQKPVLPADFLNMLDQQFARLAPTPHEP